MIDSSIPEYLPRMNVTVRENAPRGPGVVMLATFVTIHVRCPGIVTVSGDVRRHLRSILSGVKRENHEFLAGIVTPC